MSVIRLRAYDSIVACCQSCQVATQYCYCYCLLSTVLFEVRLGYVLATQEQVWTAEHNFPSYKTLNEKELCLSTDVRAQVKNELLWILYAAHSTNVSLPGLCVCLGDDEGQYFELFWQQLLRSCGTGSMLDCLAPRSVIRRCLSRYGQLACR